MKGQKSPTPPKKVSEPTIDETITEVEKTLITDENKVQQKNFENRIKWAMEDE